jgi:hypothetical protein
MKTVFARLVGQPEPGDLVIIGYRSHRGGRTHVMHRARGQRVSVDTDEKGNETPRIIPPETTAEIVTILLGEIDGPHGWMKEAFEAKAVKDPHAIAIMCTGLVADVVFFGEVEGSDKIGVEIEEI